MQLCLWFYLNLISPKYVPIMSNLPFAEKLLTLWFLTLLLYSYVMTSLSGYSLIHTGVIVALHDAAEAITTHTNDSQFTLNDFAQ